MHTWIRGVAAAVSLAACSSGGNSLVSAGDLKPARDVESARSMHASIGETFMLGSIRVRITAVEISSDFDPVESWQVAYRIHIGESVSRR